MLSFLPEWNDAPGVKDPVLAATWARLEIKYHSSSGCRWLSRLIRASSNSVDRGIYGSLFPLAEWIVENWWFLLHESCRVPELISGRQLAGDALQRTWVQRHNLLTARSGGALPDVTIYRDGNSIALRWAPDPDQDDPTTPVRFIEQGLGYADPSNVEGCFHGLVEAVLARLDAHSDDATERLRSQWSALCESRQSESALCARSASLGLDPYDEQELSDDLAEIINSHLDHLPTPVQQDLLEATTPASLLGDLDWVERVLSSVSISTERANTISHGDALTAHQWGYQEAARFRQQFSLPSAPIPNLPELLHECCSWPAADQQSIIVEGTKSFTAFAVKDRDHRPQIFGPKLGYWADRFRLARSVYFLCDSMHSTVPRLVTGAYTWDQRASRAFAAELLAPAAALGAQVGCMVSADDVDQLARRFDVRPGLIEHQIRNHRLAWLAED